MTHVSRRQFLSASAASAALLLTRPGGALALPLGTIGAKTGQGGHVGGFLVGGMIALALVALAVALGRALVRVPPTDRPATGDLVGSLATVVTTIPDHGHGEITIDQTDQRLRVNASADTPIATGATVVVLDVASPTEVLVAESGF